jgi:ABC-type microcin C transport system permease subunit YejB
VSIIYILTTKSARELHLEIVVGLPLSFVAIFPLGALVSLILVSPNGMVLLGVISS